MGRGGEPAIAIAEPHVAAFGYLVIAVLSPWRVRGGETGAPASGRPG
jgi:hypothetical protein